MKRSTGSDVEEVVAMMDDMNVADKPFRFLDLPPEIRTQIYELILPRDLKYISSLRQHASHNRSSPTKSRTTTLVYEPKGLEPQMTIPPIFLSSKQVYNEASTLLYQHNRFDIDVEIPGRLTFSTLSVQNRIRKFTDEYLIKTLASCSAHMRSLTMRVWVPIARDWRSKECTVYASIRLHKETITCDIKSTSPPVRFAYAWDLRESEVHRALVDMYREIGRVLGRRREMSASSYKP